MKSAYVPAELKGICSLGSFRTIVEIAVVTVTEKKKIRKKTFFKQYFYCQLMSFPGESTQCFCHSYGRSSEKSNKLLSHIKAYSPCSDASQAQHLKEHHQVIVQEQTWSSAGYQGDSTTRSVRMNLYSVCISSTFQALTVRVGLGSHVGCVVRNSVCCVCCLCHW